MSNLGSNLINGQWFNDGQSFTSINPSDTTDCIGTFHAASKEDSLLAIKSARDAFTEWSASSLEERKKILDYIGDELINCSTEIGELIAREEGKPLAESVDTDVVASFALALRNIIELEPEAVVCSKHLNDIIHL